MRNPRHDAHVGTDFQQFEGGIEHQISIGHLFAAYNTFSGEVGCRRHVFVDHGVTASAAVIFVRHFFAQPVAQPVGCPRFAFGNVVAQAGFQREKSPSVGLCPRFYLLIIAP